MLTYQDFEKAGNVAEFIAQAINQHRASAEYRIAVTAGLYDRQQNTTINAVTRTIYNLAGTEINDPISSNNKIANNFFHRLNTQRVAYLLGNGVTFTDHIRDIQGENGVVTHVDETKERLGDGFDPRVYDVVYNGEICGQSYCYVEYDSSSGYSFHLFPITEFVPLIDEIDGRLRAGIRFWSLDWENKPITAVLYEADGITRFRTKEGGKGLDLGVYEPKRRYNRVISTTEAEGPVVVGDENHFSALPIVPYYGKHKQSTLVGMQAALDSYDLIQSGFANDLQDCAQIYWLVGGALGMEDSELVKFRERLLLQHIGIADTDNASVTPYTQEIPYEARKVYLQHMRSSIFESFGALDVTNVAAGSRTATEIEASYQPLDEEVDALEVRVTDFIMRVLRLIGIEDVPQYKRNRISNLYEQTQMVILAAEHLSERAILEKLPWISIDEIDAILADKDLENENRREPEARDMTQQVNEILEAAK